MAHETVDTFSKLDAKGSHLKTKRSRKYEDFERGPHIIRLKKGSVPDYINLTPFQEFSWGLMGNYVKYKYKPDEDLEASLVSAHIPIRPEEHMAVAYTTALIMGIVGIILAIVLPIVLSFLGMATIGILLGVMMPILLPVAGFFLVKAGPSGKAKARGKDIDKRISGSMSFISAMASANVPVDVIFKELSKQDVYGEIQAEAEWITRDTELLGIDILTAIRRGAIRSPSTKFQDFLQGVVTTTTSGGQLKPYFLMKAEQYEKENKLLMKQTMETMAMMAESFVTVVVAFPLFLVVILAIMAIIGGTAQSTANILFMVIGIMIPMSQFGFIFVIWSMSQE
ncbi:MAG: type II secretion system F family protein [Thermoplasmata archaeon]|nr:type II secretion system F family protein [Thermoplasmata archaeon]